MILAYFAQNIYKAALLQIITKSLYLITIEIAFIYSSSGYHYHEDVAICYHDKFINCIRTS